MCYTYDINSGGIFMSEQKKVLKRSEVKKENTWATEHFYATDELWYTDLENQQCLRSQLEAFRGTLGSSAENLYKFLTFCDKMNRKLSFLANYALRKSDEDTSNSKYQEMRSKIMSFIIEIESISSFAFCAASSEWCASSVYNFAKRPSTSSERSTWNLWLIDQIFLLSSG